VIKKNISAFEFFTYIFFLISFWFRFNCILFFDNIKVIEGDFDLKISNYDDSTFIIIVTFISCICASIIRQNINRKLKQINRLEINNVFERFYKCYRFYILFIYIGSFIVIYLTNQYYEIYFKGLVNENIPAVINYIYSYLFVYGLAVITSILIYIDYSIYKNKSYFLFGLFESFFTQLNILSRSFILSFLVYLRGFLLLIDINKLKYSNFSLLKVASLILIIFYISIYSVTELRSIKYYDNNKNQTPVAATQTLPAILSLATQRWVGIDALLTVSQSKKLSYNFFATSWLEKVEIEKKSFYVENFYTKFEYHDFAKKNVNRVITPGIVAFLYYTGSPIFVFFGILILILICSYIERLFYRLSSGNIILANIIGYALTVRFIHYGYVPANTLNFFISFFVTLIFVFVITKLVSKKTLYKN